MLRLQDITLSVGGKELVEQASWHVRPGDKVGLVGRNGTGKTSLLRAIAGELHVDVGKVVVRPDVVLGYLPQTAVSGSTKTVWDEARSRMATVDALRARVDAMQAAVERGEDRAVERLDEAMESFRLAGGYAVDEHIGTVLHGLGFSRDDWTRTCDTFSGGWQMRIALARLLLSEPNLLLLDEPTNHLDLQARSWLAAYLEHYRFAVVIVSHDRYLLDRVCKRIVEVRGQRLHHYAGNFTAWLKERDLRAAQYEKAYDAQQEHIERLQRFVDRFRYKPTKAAQAQSRLKQLEEMERLDPPAKEGEPKLRLPPAPGGPVEQITLRKAVIGWADGPDVLRDIELTLERGMRIAVLGPNGCGKSTLLRALAGTLALRAGVRKIGKDVRIGSFTQDLAQDLPPDVSPLDYVLSMAPRATPGKVRGALGALGLQGETALLDIDTLSGGEKARVALACFAVQEHTTLLLDEPTNHLDAVTVDVLVEALKLFEGGLVVSTHDRFLVEQVATHIVHVHDGRIELRSGVSAADFEPTPLARERAAAITPAAEDYAARKKRAREFERMRRRIEAIHREIEAVDVELASVDEAMFTHAADYQKAQALVNERGRLDAKSAALYAEWESLELALAEP